MSCRNGLSNRAYDSDLGEAPIASGFVSREFIVFNVEQAYLNISSSTENTVRVDGSWFVQTLYLPHALFLCRSGKLPIAA